MGAEDLGANGPYQEIYAGWRGNE